MQHYWGAKAIAQRVGCAPTSLYRMKRRYGLPFFIRLQPKAPIRRILYASEAMILAWELSMSNDHSERLLESQTLPEPTAVVRPNGMQIKARMKKYSDNPIDIGQLSAEASG